nr:MobA/MobL family protein [Paracidovorax cattleyae]
MSAKPPIKRADGRSATAAAAYRAGIAIFDDRTGVKHDYHRRSGVVSARLLLPGGAELVDRAAFWNAVENHHKRRDAVVAREVIVALPVELPAGDRARLAHSFARAIADRFGVAADCAIHKPSIDGDDRNHHAHILLSACHSDEAGRLGAKCVLLDPIHCKRSGLDDSVTWLRPQWEKMVNAALRHAGSQSRVSHRSHMARGIGRRPSIHVGVGPGASQRRYRNSLHRERNRECHEIDEAITRLSALKIKLQRQQAEIAATEWSSSQAKRSVKRSSITPRGLKPPMPRLRR